MAMPKVHSTSVRGLYRTTTRHTPSSQYYGRVQIGTKAKKRRSFWRKLGVFASIEQAADAYRAFKAMIKAEQPSEEATSVAHAAQIRTLMEAQLAQLKERSVRLKARTIRTYERENRSALMFFGRKTVRKTLREDKEETEEVRDCLLSELTRPRIEEWIRFRLDTCSPGTMNRDLARLRGVLRWAEREGWMEGGNPINQIPQLRESEGVIRWLEDHEEERLREACAPWLWRMIEFSFWTGLRRGEQLGLSWDQIRNGLIEVRAKDAKSNRPRWIPITETVAKILAEQKAAPNAHPKWVFPNQSGTNRWNPYNFFKRWNKARTAAGLKDYRWHDNRHTFCSRLVQEGVPLAKVQQLAGHREFRMTQRYSHLAPTHLRGAVDALEARKRRQLLQLAGLQPRPPKELPKRATLNEDMAAEKA